MSVVPLLMIFGDSRWKIPQQTEFPPSCTNTQHMPFRDHEADIPEQEGYHRVKAFPHNYGWTHSVLLGCLYIHLPSNSACVEKQSELWRLLHVEKHLNILLCRKQQKYLSLCSAMYGIRAGT